MLANKHPAATCLVVGASGFIGRHVMASEQVFAHDLGAKLVASADEIDVRDATSMHELVRAHAPDYVLHLAAVSFVPDSISDPGATYQINFIGTLNLLTALVEERFEGSVLFVSSAEVYGSVAESELPIRESRAFAPRTPYGVSKAAGELLCQQHVLASKLDVRVVRPFNVIGAGQSSKFAVSSFARQIAALERVGGGNLAVGNLDVTRDFVDVGDAVAAFAAVLQAGRRGETYNVCSGRETRLDVLLDQFTAAASVPVHVVVDAARVRPAEQRRVCGSHEKLTTATGWQPRAALEASLQTVLDDWRAREVT